jgi:hypothetical protein
MHRRWRLGVCAIACSGVGSCAPEDSAFNFTFAPPAHEGAFQAGSVAGMHGNGDAVVEPGRPIAMDPRQQEAVVAGVARWLKDPRSVRFGSMQAVRDGRGIVTVCGWVDGRNSAGAYRGLAPYIGLLMGTRNGSDFVVVGIGGTRRDRVDVLALCEEVGVRLEA